MQQRLSKTLIVARMFKSGFSEVIAWIFDFRNLNWLFCHIIILIFPKLCWYISLTPTDMQSIHTTLALVVSCENMWLTNFHVVVGVYICFIDLGREQSVVLDNLNSEEILQELKTLVLNGSKTWQYFAVEPNKNSYDNLPHNLLLVKINYDWNCVTSDLFVYNYFLRGWTLVWSGIEHVCHCNNASMSVSSCSQCPHCCNGRGSCFNGSCVCQVSTGH